MIKKLFLISLCVIGLGRLQPMKAGIQFNWPAWLSPQKNKETLFVGLGSLAVGIISYIGAKNWQKSIQAKKDLARKKEHEQEQRDRDAQKCMRLQQYQDREERRKERLAELKREREKDKFTYRVLPELLNTIGPVDSDSQPLMPPFHVDQINIETEPIVQTEGMSPSGKRVLRHMLQKPQDCMSHCAWAERDKLYWLCNDNHYHQAPEVPYLSLDGLPEVETQHVPAQPVDKHNNAESPVQKRHLSDELRSSQTNESHVFPGYQVKGGDSPS